MIIGITGSVGTGKTKLADMLADELKCRVLHLNFLAEKYMVEKVDELQTFDFDLDKLLDEVEPLIKTSTSKNLIVESHFTHMIDPKLIDILFVINRDLTTIRKVYESRGYNEKKMEQNLEAESFNVCFYEGLENGYEEEKQIFCVSNDGDEKELIEKVLEILEK